MTNDRAQACLLFFPVSNREVRGRRSPGSAHVCTRVYDYKRCTHAVPCSLHCGKTGRRDPHPDEFHRRGDIYAGRVGMDISSVMLLRGLGYVHVWETYIRASSGSCGLQIYRSKWIGVQSLRVSISGSVVVKTKQLCRPYYLA